MDNKIEDFFQESEGAGIDDDNLTIFGSGEGFNFGSDFDIPDFDIPDFDEPDFDIPDFDIPDFNRLDFEPVSLENRNPLISSLFELDEDAPFPNPRIVISEYSVVQNPELDISPGWGRQSEELRGVVFDSEYYLEQNPDIKATAQTNATVSHAFDHFSEYGISEDREHRYVFPWDFFPPEDTESSEDSLSGASANVAGEEQDFDSSTVSESESEPVLDPEVKTARINFFQDYLTSGIEGSIADADLGLGTTSYINSDEVSLEPSDDSLL